MAYTDHTPTFDTHTAAGEAAFLKLFRPGLSVTIRRGEAIWDGFVQKVWASGETEGVGGMMVKGTDFSSAFAFDPRNEPQQVTVYL